VVVVFTKSDSLWCALKGEEFAKFSRDTKNAYGKSYENLPAEKVAVVKEMQKQLFEQKKRGLRKLVREKLGPGLRSVFVSRDIEGENTTSILY
jgi:hypothetical protein